MTFCELLTLIGERNETILNQESSALITTSHRYLRQSGDWIEDAELGAPVEKYTRAGKIWQWNRTEQTNEPG